MTGLLLSVAQELEKKGWPVHFVAEGHRRFLHLPNDLVLGFDDAAGWSLYHKPVHPLELWQRVEIPLNVGPEEESVYHMVRAMVAAINQGVPDPGAR